MSVRTLIPRFGHGDMVVHDDDFIVAGCGDDLDWLSQKLNEKLELVPKARLGPGYDSEATVLNRCVVDDDSGQSWQWQNSDSSRRVHRRAQAAPSRVHNLTMKKWSLTDRKPTTACQQDWAYLAADQPDIVFARKECIRAVGKATRANLTRLKRIGRYLLHAPRAVCCGSSRCRPKRAS